MSWTHVQGTGAAASEAGDASIVATFGSSVTAGNLIVVCIANYGSFTPVVSDSKNSVDYTLAANEISGSFQSLIYYYIPLIGGTGFEISAVAGGESYFAISIDEYSFSPGASISVDSNAGATGSASPATLASALTVSGTDLIVAVTQCPAYGTYTVGSGFTAGYTNNYAAGNSMGIGTEYLLNETSNVNPTMAVTASSWYFAAAAFKATGGGSGPTTATLSGPTIGLIGVTSTNFTITLNQAAQSGGVSCPITSSHSGDTITSTPVVIASGQTTGTFTVTPSPHNLGDVGARNITLGATTPSLTIENSPIPYLASAYYPAAMMLGL